MRVYQFRHFGKEQENYRSFCDVVQRQISPYGPHALVRGSLDLYC
jgi:hypothetical protein